MESQDSCLGGVESIYLYTTKYCLGCVESIYLYTTKYCLGCVLIWNPRILV